MELSDLKIPTHVSIIMDGNGRWAKSAACRELSGIKEVRKVVMDICQDADDLGINI